MQDNLSSFLFEKLNIPIERGNYYELTNLKSEMSINTRLEND